MPDLLAPSHKATTASYTPVLIGNLHFLSKKLDYTATIMLTSLFPRSVLGDVLITLLNLPLAVSVLYRLLPALWHRSRPSDVVLPRTRRVNEDRGRHVDDELSKALKHGLVYDFGSESSKLRRGNLIRPSSGKARPDLAVGESNAFVWIWFA